MNAARTKGEYRELFALIGQLYGAPPDEPEEQLADEQHQDSSNIPGTFTTNDAVGNREDI